ncbi:Iron ABC transporter permease component (plasmid) [Sodalis praecaptivus]|uniref:Iron ABC transporter permease component n=1 Tax=Sodalis praecaptivus TaxID=1239307 RepID=W0I3L8_9GAMM|nr:metal ABC transporter permease [Sodalis praecaptivus]AHF79332.1 Iron ABC transporter permease component [Sodalis praecaptivus]
MSLTDTLLMPFHFAFMNNAFLIVLLIAVPASLLSCLMVLKGWALMGDAMSHAVFPGVIIAYMIGLPLAVGAFVAGLVCAMTTGFLKNNSRIKHDTLMGIVFSGMFGVGLVMYVKVQSTLHLQHILFGDMLGIGADDLIEAAVISAATVLFIAVKWKDLLLQTFDAVQAKASSLNVRLLHYGLLCFLALTIVAALKAVGIILSVSLLIAPGAIAFLITKKFWSMMLASVAIAVAGGFLGVYVSFFLDSSPGATIVLFFTLMFAAVFLIKGVHSYRVRYAA